MLDSKRSRMCGYLLAAVLSCGIPLVLCVTKGQRVRSSPDIPVTQFTCTGRPPGYYADLETGCQVYHMCTEGGNQFSYRCPNTTLFQQRMLICAHWYQVNCSRSEQHYGANLLIGQRDKPFVNDDPALFPKEKQLKTLQNPETLQNLGQSRGGSARQAKSQIGSDQSKANRIHQNNLKRDGESSFGVVGKTTTFSSFFPTTDSPSEDLASLPLAGSVLPGGLKSFQISHTPGHSFPANSKAFHSTPPPHQSSTRGRQVSNSARQTFVSPTQPPNFINRVNLFATTKSPVSFTSKFFPDNINNFQPGGFKKQNSPENIFEQTSSTPQPNSHFLRPSDQNQATDLAVASQENALHNRQSSSSSQDFQMGESLPETDVKAIIEQTKNGSYPDDKFNTFIKRFNPYEEPIAVTLATKTDEPEPEYHTFINRFVPEEGQSGVSTNFFKDRSEEHVFINRFVLTPEEENTDKDRQNVDQLHDLLPPVDQITASFPSFDLVPPLDDADDSESNKIELHLQDPRKAFFIPSDDAKEFSKADAAPIVVTIPLQTHQKSPPMWFRTNESSDPCARCQPSFIVNKDLCMPCVIIR